jgi:hypothetical protein
MAKPMNGETCESIYTNGSYLQKTGGTWHLEDSPFKAGQVTRMLARHPQLQLATVCEIGCGAGGILAELQKVLPSWTVFTGYEISTQAHTISLQFENRRCKYVLGDAFGDSATYDLALVMDVIEHVEDCFSFLRKTKQKGRWKLYHIPLETHVSATLRGVNSWESVGHLHLFTAETALKTIEYTGHRILDWIFTPGAFAKRNSALHLRSRLANVLRLPLWKLGPRFTVRLLGGYSILILAE